MCEMSKDLGKKMKIWVNVNMVKRMIILKKDVKVKDVKVKDVKVKDVKVKDVKVKDVKVKDVKMMDKVKTVEKSRR